VPWEARAMTDSGGAAWRRRIEVAERAVAGFPGAPESLTEEAGLLVEDRQLLRTPAAAKAMSYFIALLRELGSEAEQEYDFTLSAVQRWVEEGGVPQEHRCAVYSRIGAVLAESGEGVLASRALHVALKAAIRPSEEAYALVRLAELDVRALRHPSARIHAERAARLVPRGADSATWLDVRMRSAYALLRIEYQSSLVRELVYVCGWQIDRWGDDHPRALEALTIMTVAQHADAEERGDSAAAERFVDVLAVTAQRSASLLGARHPQARAAREALPKAHRVPEGARVGRRGARRRGTSYPRLGGGGPLSWADTANLANTASGATETPRRPVIGMRRYDSAWAADLREAVTQARLVLWGLDGPICRLFAGHPANMVAEDLVRWLEAQGLGSLLRPEKREVSDPQTVLRAVANRSPYSDLVLELEERLTQEELRAVASAMPTAYADPLIRTWAALGAQQAIATNNSSQVAYRYLEGRDLAACFASHIYGRTQHLGLLKPNPYSVHRALNATAIPPSSALMIGDTPTDYLAARQAGVAFLGYARDGRREKALRDAGAELIVTSLEQVLHILRPLPG